MANNWMVRAGRGGIYSEDFEKGYVAIGWSDLGDLSQYATPDDLRSSYINVYGNEKPAKTSNAVAMILKFRDQIKTGDYLLSYNPETREYLVGKDQGQYSHQPDLIGDYANVRAVDWLGKVSRDKLSQKARNLLGSVLTLFSVKQFVIDEFLTILEGKPTLAEVEGACDSDDDNDGILDIVEHKGNLDLDTDKDGFPDHKDLDSDNDTCTDVIEAGFLDPDNDGFLGTLPDDVDVFGKIINESTGYTNPDDNDNNGVFDFQENQIPDPGKNNIVELCLSSLPVNLFDKLLGTPETGGTWSPSLSGGNGIFRAKHYYWIWQDGRRNHWFRCQPANGSGRSTRLR